MNIACAPRPAAFRLVVNGEPPRGLVRQDQFAQARLVDRNATFAQARDFALVELDADHLVAEIGETGSRYKPDVAGPDHHDAHQANPIPPPQARRHGGAITKTISSGRQYRGSWRPAVQPVVARSNRPESAEFTRLGPRALGRKPDSGGGD